MITPGVVVFNALNASSNGQLGSIWVSHERHGSWLAHDVLQEEAQRMLVAERAHTAQLEQRFAETAASHGSSEKVLGINSQEKTRDDCQPIPCVRRFTSEPAY